MMITIQKCGIFRKIDEKNLPKYKSRGYAMVEQSGKTKTEQKASAKNGNNGK
jgi:hypothetical protein